MSLGDVEQTKEWDQNLVKTAVCKYGGGQKKS